MTFLYISFIVSLSRGTTRCFFWNFDQIRSLCGFYPCSSAFKEEFVAEHDVTELDSVGKKKSDSENLNVIRRRPSRILRRSYPSLSRNHSDISENTHWASDTCRLCMHVVRASSVWLVTQWFCSRRYLSLFLKLLLIRSSISWKGAPSLYRRSPSLSDVVYYHVLHNYSSQILFSWAEWASSLYSISFRYRAHVYRSLS